MEDNKKEFLSTVCNLYVIALLVVLPLYTGGSYYKIGDSKYMLFRNVSLICIGLWIVVTVVSFIGVFLQKPGSKEVFNHRTKWSIVDIFVLSYGICVFISAFCSSYQKTAWMGYQDWYMGALSQLFFVAIYFFVSRQFSYNAIPIFLGEVALLGVTVIGFLNRLEIDPLGLYAGFNRLDWEYSHMISTIGNINWLCGYYSVALALPMAGYLYSKRTWKKWFLYIVNVLGLTLLFVQGSDSGPVIVLVGIGICLLAGVHKPEFFRRGLLLAVGVTFLLPVFAHIVEAWGTEAATPTDGDIYAKILWWGWWLVTAFLAVVCVIHGRLQGKTRRTVTKVFLGIVILTGVLLIGLKLLSGEDVGTWGSGRGILWEMALGGFAKAQWGQKLIGAGPDCFAEYLTEIGIGTVITKEGHWADAVYANAHNEWLNHLVNIGILGVCCYVGIFVSVLKRYRGMILGVLVLGMYGVHSLVSFQQVLNTPLLFLILGLCESQVIVRSKS